MIDDYVARTAVSYDMISVQLDQADTSPNLRETHSLSLYAYMVICPYELHEFCFELPCVLLVATAKKKKGPLSPDIFPWGGKHAAWVVDRHPPLSHRRTSGTHFRVARAILSGVPLYMRLSKPNTFLEYHIVINSRPRQKRPPYKLHGKVLSFRDIKQDKQDKHGHVFPV